MATWLIGVVALGFVGRKMFLVHGLIEPPLTRWEGRPTMLAAYFIRTKILRVVRCSYYPSEPIVLEQISGPRPNLIQNVECKGVGRDDSMTISSIGCRFLNPPSVAFDMYYPFNRTLLPIMLAGLSGWEPSGRGNQRAVSSPHIVSPAWLAGGSWWRGPPEDGPAPCRPTVGGSACRCSAVTGPAIQRSSRSRYR